MFANPFQGVPILITCKAETPEGRFATTFRSDGSEPVIIMKDGQMIQDR